CGSEAEAGALLAEVGAQIELKLADRIYSRGGETLEAVIGDLLRRQHATLVVAESATGGGLAERVTQVPGSSDYFLGGFVVYNRRMKVTVLGIDEALIEQYGPVSKEVAELMANAARLRSGATYALAITGNAGPGTDGPRAPAGTIFVALADAAGASVIHRQFFGDRARVKQFAGQMALDMLRRRLQRTA
ncbi:MAG TPA: competence/damage-inducible protein A, partial [Solibacterales bacterium]|nr:competence/damage-inducible protein A [Bryobacterales bacterium]